MKKALFSAIVFLSLTLVAAAQDGPVIRKRLASDGFDSFRAHQPLRCATLLASNPNSYKPLRYT